MIPGLSSFCNELCGVGFVMRMEGNKKLTIPLGHIRIRLTLCFAIFGLLFAAYICAACFLQYWQLKQQLYHAEVQDMETYRVSYTSLPTDNCPYMKSISIDPHQDSCSTGCWKYLIQRGVYFSAIKS